MTTQGLLLDGVNPTARHEEDFYATPAYQTRALLKRLPSLDGLTVLEPCCGDGAITRLLPRSCRCLTNDLVCRPPMVRDFGLDATTTEAWARFREWGPIDVVLTNPPFNVAFPIIQHALDVARVAVIMLLRLSWLEPTKQRSTFLAEYPPDGLIVLPRHDYRGNGSTDSVTSAWVVWQLGRHGLARDLNGIEIVSLAERDALLAEEPR